MAATARTRISCDRRGHYCLGSAEFDGGPRDARARAKGAGWRRWQYPPMDICPACTLERP